MLYISNLDVYCGETGIRTPGTLRYNGFQDRRYRPLSHLSELFLGSAFLLKRCKGNILFLNIPNSKCIFLKKKVYF